MGKIKATALPLKGALLISPFRSKDSRGDFIKPADGALFRKLRFRVRDMFYSTSRKGVIRGLHFQNPNPQAKLVFCAKGSIYDVIVDLRKKSPTFKKWYGRELSEKNGNGFYIPRGFAHGFACLKKGSLVLYFADERYCPKYDTGVLYSDKELGIKWPVPGKPTVSKRDSSLPPLRRAKLFD